jgi:hypothetical protein
MIGKIEDKADRIGPAVQEIKNQAENDRKVATRGYQLIVKSLRAGPGILHRTISGVSA